jgi:CO/xanthine dehydrogenase Mo-binding subunit
MKSEIPDSGQFLRSPHANARIKKIDTTKARAIPGVVDIITWDDKDIGKLRSGGDGGFLMGPTQSFLDDQTDQEGAEVGAIVVAESEDLCEEALRALVVEWAEHRFVVDLRKGRAPDAPPVVRQAPPARNSLIEKLGLSKN